MIVDEVVVLNTCGEYLVRGKLTSDIWTDTDLLFTADRYRLSKRNVLAADALYDGSQLINNIVMIRLINPMIKRNILYKGTKLGKIGPVTKVGLDAVNMLDNNEEKGSERVVTEILDRHQGLTLIL
ncbi:MAG: hypothetical protein AAGK05_03850 [Pseudomonadota bacterium]